VYELLACPNENSIKLEKQQVGKEDEKMKRVKKKKKQKRKGITMLYINNYGFCTTGLSYY
jgi:hypothetical protein